MSISRAGEKLEIVYKKVVHLRDYENEEFTAQATATYSGSLSSEDRAEELARMQAEVEIAVFRALRERKLIIPRDYEVRVSQIPARFRPNI
jgi:hypothetical protein